MNATEYTLYFAWVAPKTAWSVGLARFDENVFDLVIEHDEGQIPTALVEIRNPRIGLISPSRLYWAWVSYSRDACEPQPLFFGRLFGIPEDMINNTLKLKFIAHPDDYIPQKQRVARSLKVLPNYDPIFFETSKRDDPDAILEGWSALYHVDRVDLRVSASDILIGEDGTVNFAASDVFYDSVKFRVLQPPLLAVNVKADVQWEQQYRGSFYVGQWAWPTLGGDAFVGDWPKSGAQLGGGWSAGVSWAGERDPNPYLAAQLTAQPQVNSVNYQWTNQAKQHQFGDTMSISINYTPPFGTAHVVKETSQVGVQNPDNVDAGGNPDPLNIPAKLSIDWFCYRGFALNFLGKQSLATLGLIYQADRKRSERLEMTVTGDVQPVEIDPTVIESTEQITLKSGDLSLPLIDLLNWDSVGMGGSVSQGQIIFPDNPLVPGQTSSQIALNSGSTGAEQPIFSNIAGQTTADGSVTWVSLGDTQPSDTTQDWMRLARVPLGTMIVPKLVSGVPDLDSAKAPGALNYPPTGTAIPMFSVFCSGSGGPGDTMYETTAPGFLGGPNVQAPFNVFKNPSGAFMYIAIQAGTTGQFHITFPESTGAQVSDGSVIWQCLGQVNLPIGGTPGMTPASSYFPTDRGQQSVRHMFCRARAKIRKRSRAVELSFDTRFEVAAILSCRMNGHVSDVRLPSGTAFGKVISYKIEAHGEEGIFQGSVVLGCSVGKENIGVTTFAGPTTDPGIPSYVGVAGPVNGYVQVGYQQYYSSVSGALPGTPPDQGVGFTPLPLPPNWPHLPPTLPPLTCPPLNSTWSAGPSDPVGNEMTYTPPINSPNDDGINFPVSPGDVTLKNEWHGVASTINPINLQIYNLQLQQIVHDAIQQNAKTVDLPSPPLTAIGQPITHIPVPNLYDIQVAIQIKVLQELLKGSSLWYELVLKPLTNGPFSSYYVVNTTPLQIPQTINLG